MNSPQAPLVSPDGAFVYLASHSGIRGFARAPDGRLTPLTGVGSCIALTGSPDCALQDPGASNAEDIVASSDGRFLYLGERDGMRVLVVARDRATGLMSLLGGAGRCVSDDGVVGTAACERTVPAMANPAALALSPDERFLYVGDFNDASITAIARDPETGRLNPLTGAGSCVELTARTNCVLEAPAMNRVSDLVVDPTGAHIFAASRDSNSAFVLNRDPASGLMSVPAGTGSCIQNGTGLVPGAQCNTTAPGLEGAWSVELSRDQKTLFVGTGAGGSIASLRIAADGRLSAGSCVKDVGSSATCATTVGGLAFVFDMTRSRTGEFLYASAFTSSVIRAFDVQADGSLKPHAPPGDCVQDGDGSAPGSRCASTNTLPGMMSPEGLALSPDGAALYAAAGDSQTLRGFAVEVAPVCTPATVSTAFQTPTPVTVACADANGQPVTRTAATAPAHGTLSAFDSAGTATYTPAAGYSGPDAFTVGGSDGTNASNTVTVSVSVAAGGPGPTLLPGTLRIVSRMAKLDRRGRVTLSVGCGTGGGRCTGQLVLKSAKRLKLRRKGRAKSETLGRSAVDLAAGGTGKVVIKLSKASRAFLTRTRKLAARVEFVRAGARTASATQQVALSAPRRR